LIKYQLSSRKGAEIYLADLENKTLSQEEVNLLFNGVVPNQNKSSEDDDGGFVLSGHDMEIITRIVTVSMNKSAEVLSVLLNKPVKSERLDINETTWEKVKDIIPPECLLITVNFIEGLQWVNFLVMINRDAAMIAELMMGNTGQVVSDELDDLQLSAVGEAMNQMMGSTATTMSDMFTRKVTISTPVVKKVNLTEESIDFVSRFGSDYVVQVKIHFKLVFEEPISIEIIQLIPIANAIEMIKNLVGGGLAERSESGLQAPPDHKEQSTAQSPTVKVLEEPTPKVTVQQVQFMPFDKKVNVQPVEFNKLELIYDVPLQFTVELGRTEKTLKEILDIGPGSIVGLEKLAGEPVDIMVNGKLIAKGEVIVIDENYGVRIKEILNSEERFSSLKSRG
jgi:flagellar motor switch protein FliN/FliY